MNIRYSGARKIKHDGNDTIVHGEKEMETKNPKMTIKISLWSAIKMRIAGMNTKFENNTIPETVASIKDDGRIYLISMPSLTKEQLTNMKIIIEKKMKLTKSKIYITNTRIGRLTTPKEE